LFFLGGVAVVVIGLALMVGIIYTATVYCFYCPDLLSLGLSIGGASLLIGWHLFKEAFADDRRQLSVIAQKNQLTLAKAVGFMKPTKKDNGVDGTQQGVTADEILGQENPNRPAIVTATAKSNRAEKWNETKQVFADFAKNILKLSWGTDEDKEVDDETNTEPTPRTPVQLEEARRRNLMKDWVRDAINNEAIFKMARFDLNKPEQYQKIMELRTKSHKNHMKRIIYLTLGEYYKEKKYEYSIPYTIDHNMDKFQPFLDKAKNAKKMTEAQKKDAREEFAELFQKYRKQPPQDAIFEAATPEEKAQSQARREEERIKEGEELGKRYQENHATTRDLRTKYFAGVSRAFIKTHVNAQRIKIQLQRTKAEASNNTKMQKVLDAQETMLDIASEEIDEIITSDNIEKDD
jgi:hypothetical protein